MTLAGVKSVRGVSLLTVPTVSIIGLTVGMVDCNSEEDL